MKVSVTLAELAVAIAEAAREEALEGEDVEALAAATLVFALSHSTVQKRRTKRGSA